MTGPNGHQPRHRRRPGPVRPLARVWPDEEPGLPPLDGIVPALETFAGVGDAPPLEIELRLSAFLGELGAGSVEPLDVGEPGHEELVNGLVEVCLHHLEQSPPRVLLDFLWVVDAFGLGYLQWPVHDRLADSPLPSRPAWAWAVGSATITGTQLLSHEMADGVDVAIRARHPGADVDHVLAVHIDHNLDGLAKDFLVHDDAEEFLRLTSEVPGMSVTDIDPATAAAMIDSGIDVTFETGSMAPVSEEFGPLFSIVEHYVAKLPPGGAVPDPAAPASSKQQVEVVEAFLATDDGQRHVERRDLLLDAVEFVVDQLGGDPLRWSPVVTHLVSVGWLPMSGHGGAGGDAFLDTLRDFVPWAHAEHGWGDRYVADTLEVLDAAAAPAPAAGGLDVSRVDVLQRALEAGVDLDDEDALDAFLDAYLDE